jgi:hypothetical protein
MKSESFIGQWIDASENRLRSFGAPRHSRVEAVWTARGTRPSSVTIVRWHVNAEEAAHAGPPGLGGPAPPRYWHSAPAVGPDF